MLRCEREFDSEVPCRNASISSRRTRHVPLGNFVARRMPCLIHRLIVKVEESLYFAALSRLSQTLSALSIAAPWLSTFFDSTRCQGLVEGVFIRWGKRGDKYLATKVIDVEFFNVGIGAAVAFEIASADAALGPSAVFPHRAAT